MNIQTIPLADLSLDPSNVRKHSRRNLDAIKASLRKFGQQKPIVVDAKGIVLAGNGTLTAAQELGWTEIQIVRTELAGVEATAFAIADNRTAELAEWEEDKLDAVLRSLQDEGVDLADLGYSAEDMAKMQTPDFAAGTVDDQGKLDEKSPIECPHCHKSFTP
jgi:ParB-like chromosome segregation protein Spo0J